MLKPNLFDISLKKVSVPQDVLEENLGFATLNVDVEFDSHKISSLNPPQVGSITPHSFIAIWEEKLIHAELLKTKYHPRLPSGMKIAYSWAYLWRIKAKKDLPVLTFACFLRPEQPIIDTDIETGEGLFSKSFSFGDDFIHIGTEDEDYLFQRANTNNGLPARYVKEKKIDYGNHNSVTDSDLGIQVQLPPLKAGELAQVQFIIAGGTDPTANWYAVDASPKEILLQGGGGKSY